MSSDRSPSNGQSVSDEDRRSISPAGRRAFGCVTWVYMGILAFLLANFLISLPFRFVGNPDIYGYVPARLAFLGLALILPGMALAAVLGFRTYRAEKARAKRVGAGIGALIGWAGFFTLVWFSAAFGFDQRDQAFNVVVFPNFGDSYAFYVFPQLIVLATIIVVFSLYSKRANFEIRRRTALAGTAPAMLAGFLVIVTSFDTLGIAGALISTVSAAFGGYVSGMGYARAGGDDRIPPGATIKKPREPRGRPR
ncbi:MAG: hypothetical protein M3475_06390 [Actinomycetota bacterium]|nr:hypothetical protein [Actinomycetota bacterium]